MKFQKVLTMMALPILIAILAFSSIDNAYADGYDLGDSQYAASSLLFSYYDVRAESDGGPGLTDNYFTVVNTTSSWVQGHIRVRSGECSVELLDFDVVLSPEDVFTFDLYKSGDDTLFASCDKNTLVASGWEVDSDGCIFINPGDNDYVLLKECGECPDGDTITTAEARAAARYGYVEFIGEGIFDGVDTDSDCEDDSGSCCESQLEDGEYILYSWDDDGCDVDPIEWETFIGRVYYAKFEGEWNITQLATSNAVGLYTNTEEGYAIVHRPCYSDDSEGCSTGDGELEHGGSAAYAYNAAGESPGADDLNYCFWNDGTADEKTYDNRVGAAATFGPTFLDLGEWNTSLRDGTADTAEDIAEDLNDMYLKYSAASHYWELGDLGQTKYVFTFPLQHFVNQEIEITPKGRWDTEEDKCTIPSKKFVSPGLAPPGVPAGEVYIVKTTDITSTCSYAEGWVKMDLEVTDNAAGLDMDYPAIFGVVVNQGDISSGNTITTAPMHWIGFSY